MSRGHERLPPDHSRTRSADSSSGSSRTPPGAPRSACGDERRHRRRARAAPARCAAPSRAPSRARRVRVRSAPPTRRSGRASPRSSWLRNGCERPASPPSALSVSPRSRRSSEPARRGRRPCRCRSFPARCLVAPGIQSNGGSASVGGPAALDPSTGEQGSAGTSRAPIVGASCSVVMIGPAAGASCAGVAGRLLSGVRASGTGPGWDPPLAGGAGPNLDPHMAARTLVLATRVRPRDRATTPRRVRVQALASLAHGRRSRCPRRARRRRPRARRSRHGADPQRHG